MRQKHKVDSPDLEEDEKHEKNSTRGNKKDSRQRRAANERDKEGKVKKRSQPQGDSRRKTSKAKPVIGSSTTKPARPRNEVSTEPEHKRGDKVNSESIAQTSEEATEEELSNEEEELSCNEEPQRSEEEEEASDMHRDGEQVADKESDNDLSEEDNTRSDSEVKLVKSSTEERQNEAEEKDKLNSDVSEDEKMSQENASEKTTLDETSSEPVKVTERQKSKMLKKTKADKKVEKAERRRAKAERQRAEKEAKRKAKEEKKKRKENKEKSKSASKSTQRTNVTHNKADAAKCKIQIGQAANKTKNGEKNSDPEIKEAEPAESKTTKGQELDTVLDPECAEDEQQKDQSDVRARAGGAFLRKARIASLRQTANKMTAKLEEETSEIESVECDSNKPKDRLIAPRKGMTTLRRVSGWIQKKMPKELNLRKKLCAWTKAIGASRWLALQTQREKQGIEKPKSNLLKHRMAIRVASRSTLASRKPRNSSENKMEMEILQKAGEGGEEAAPSGEKEAEAKFAAVLPRMNKVAQPKTNQDLKKASGPSTPSSSTASTGEASASENKTKPPQPGARLVLPVKPDLSILKSMKMPLPGGLTSGGDLAERNSSSNTENRNRRTGQNNQDGVGVLQLSKGKMNSSQVNLTKMTLGTNRANVQIEEKEATADVPRSTMQPLTTVEGGVVMSGVRSLYEEEADREVAQLMGEGGIYPVGPQGLHWAGNPQMSGDPQDWLRAENLLPYQTVEKLTKWTVYDNGGQVRTVPAHNGRGPWESEDPKQDMLESRLASTQVVMPGSKRAVEVDEVEDLSQLE
ncbi:caldesmon [Thalassophryne amazonica]|uniref:caldesmon n=1 Tax=Thalassophryne amazonica TaxID=390379 RepID=UPI001471432C|nr:caldesmon [Thalassophryne amazonica]